MTESNEGAGRFLWPILLLGIAADFLFRADGLGLNVALWLGGAVWAWWHHRRRTGETPVGAERALLMAVLALGVAAMWRENPMLRFLDAVALVAIFTILPIVAAPAGAAAFWELSIGRLTLAVLQLVRRGLVGVVPSLLDANRSTQARRAGMAPTLSAVARGTVLTVPALLIFGGLLGNADRAFGDFLEGLVRFNVEELAVHAVAILGASWVAAALLCGALADERLKLSRHAVASRAGLGRVEIVMILGLVNLLFASFIAFQLPYFFGGAAWVERTAGITLAEYARNGFFQLVVVSGLVLPMLLGLHSRITESEGRVGGLYRSLAAWQVVLVLVIMASAIHRMALYQREYGLTEDRFFASAFMAGLAVTFCWFGATVLRGSAERFTGGALAAWAGWLMLLHVVNPERVIVEVNLARAEAGKPLDTDYLSRLSSDATPALIAGLGRVTPEQRPALEKAFRAANISVEQGWRAWHYGRAAAREQIARTN